MISKFFKKPQGLGSGDRFPRHFSCYDEFSMIRFGLPGALEFFPANSLTGICMAARGRVQLADDCWMLRVIFGSHDIGVVEDLHS